MIPLYSYANKNEKIKIPINVLGVRNGDYLIIFTSDKKDQKVANVKVIDLVRQQISKSSKAKKAKEPDVMSKSEGKAEG